MARHPETGKPLHPAYLKPARFTPVGSVLAEILESCRKSGGGDLEDILSAWEAICGPAIAANTRPESLRKKTLTVHTTGSVWIQQLAFLKQDLICNINGRLERNAVSDVRFRVGPV